MPSLSLLFTCFTLLVFNGECDSEAEVKLLDLFIGCTLKLYEKLIESLPG